MPGLEVLQATLPQVFRRAARPDYFSCLLRIQSLVVFVEDVVYRSLDRLWNPRRGYLVSPNVFFRGIVRAENLAAVGGYICALVAPQGLRCPASPLLPTEILWHSLFPPTPGCPTSFVISMSSYISIPPSAPLDSVWKLGYDERCIHVDKLLITVAWSTITFLVI